MPTFVPPLRDMQFVMHELLGVEPVLAGLPAHAEVNRELIDQVLEEGGKFCSEVIFPLNLPADEQGCRHEGDGVVRAPDGFADAYRQYCEAGWPTLTCEPEFGGQGLPHVVGMAMQEMLNSASQAWTMYPGLSHGAYECLLAHGTDELKQLYLPKLISGQWTGTMCLTEPHCGTDLGMLRSRAEPQDDGSYRITGNKIFISAGEHDMAENIIHLVLARLPDAPAGTKGISLFVVPKFLPGADGGVGERNAVQCSRIEEKMGIHANATCAMDFESASGWLVGEPNRGLNAMFVMMNAARIGVGLQSLGLMEVAYQNSVSYARERLQMRSLTGPKAPDKPADPIIVHPDVRRMLLTQRAWIEGCRAFAMWLALQSDVAASHPDAGERERAEGMLTLLTPVVKAFLTDNGFAATNLAMQVYGGHGFIREWGMEQYVRDARINLIYEGTNGIQALDLLGRKVLSDGGARLRAFGAMVRELVEEQGTDDDMAEFINPLADLAGKFEKFAMEIGMKAMGNADEVGAASVDFLRVLGHLALGYFWARMARIALDRRDGGDRFYEAKLAVARFYFARLLPETAALMRSARSGAANLMELDAELF
ncbi:MAG: acyl-CoA dehydrogenase C-terminal domain-containing protein [Burkholderiaceae bacterium]